VSDLTGTSTFRKPPESRYAWRCRGVIAGGARRQGLCCAPKPHYTYRVHRDVYVEKTTQSNFLLGALRWPSEEGGGVSQATSKLVNRIEPSGSGVCVEESVTWR